MNVSFFTVCGGGEDYDFLLGSIEHHAAMGGHVVLDTTPSGKEKRFKGLPSSVIWVYEPIYGSGWKEFRFRAALTRACALASKSGAEVVAQLDCDEFFSGESVEGLFPLAKEAMVWVEAFHWMSDRRLYSFGPLEFHPRLWPALAQVTWPINQAWVSHPSYNGNPDHHAIVRAPEGLRHDRVPGVFHHHVHYAVGDKAKDDETARATIKGWPNGTPVPGSWPWPGPLREWAERGKPPSLSFQEEAL